MRLPSGAILGAYQIVAPLGAGGMGEVYRARDSSLKREVAIKIIPEPYSSDPERLHRFQLEAEAAAALNHPNIVTVHQVGRDNGTSYIVSELLQGETLRERLRAGPLPARAAIDFGAQIARGLAAAHERGIVHRDLKPENIFVTRDGRIKILDFGLAKLFGRQPDLESNTQSTASTATYTTEPGTVAGTAAYMSPEQVRGRSIDFHTDIFALGAVLYEMLTGKKAFARPTSAETMTAILNEDPPSLAQSGKNIAPALQRVVHRCLEKKREQRFQSASDLAFALEALSDPSDSSAVAFTPPRRLQWLWILAACCAVAIAAFVLWLWLTPSVPVVESITQITDDGQPKFDFFTDGSRIYFAEGEYGATRIVQVSASGGSTAPVENAPPNYYIAALKQDGSEMLLQGGKGEILALPLPGGEPRRILDGVINADIFPDGSIPYVTQRQGGGSDLFIADKDGSNPRKIKSFPDLITGIATSPDGRQILAAKRRKNGEGDYIIEFFYKDGSPSRDILDVHPGNNGAIGWGPDQRFLLYTRELGYQSDMWAIPFSKRLFHRSSGPIRLTSGPLSYQGAASSPDGRRIFTVGAKQRAELVRFDMGTHQFLPYLPGLSATEPHFSADGKWMTYISVPDFSVWRCRIDGTERMQLTFPPMIASYPRFSPDGSKISFTSSERASYVVDVSGGQPGKLADRAFEAEWSPDGRSVIFTRNNNGVPSIQSLDLASGKTTEIPSARGTANALFVDANTLVALNYIDEKFVTFDMAARKWSDLLSLPSYPTDWQVSPDHKYLFFTIGGEELHVERIAFASRKAEPVTDLKHYDQIQDPFDAATDSGVAPDGSPIFARDISSQEIYAVTIRWP